MIYGYARVSTAGQAKDGNSLEAQEKALTQAGAQKIYYDRFTGTSMERPEFDKLIGELKEGDQIIVTKLDRFGRSCSKASQIITDLIEKGITVNVLNVGVLSNNSMSTLLRNVLLAFAQFERDMIVERTQEGKAIARKNPNFKEGRPATDRNKMLYAMSLLDDKHSYSQVVEMTGISKSTLIRFRNNQKKENKGE